MPPTRSRNGSTPWARFEFECDERCLCSVARHGGHKNVQALEADIRAWVKSWNEAPKPFIWTTAIEEILDSRTRFCRRISGAGHYLRFSLVLWCFGVNG